MVDCSADQQNSAAKFWRLLPNQVDRNCQTVQNGRSAVSRPRSLDCFTNAGQIRREILKQMGLAIEGYHRNLVRNIVDHRFDHCLKMTKIRKLLNARATSLDRNNERHRLLARTVIQSRVLLDPIVPDRKVRGCQRKDEITGFSLDQRGNQDQVGLCPKLDGRQI